ncbi:hypothetical protein BH09VER1_BH09VER1_28820 [soil metagenome]
MKTIDSKNPPFNPTPTLARRLLMWLFGKGYETMSGAGMCPVYLERWVMFEALKCGVYLHRFIGDDWAIDPHDHPRRFISIGLKGWYWEDIYRNPATDPAASLLPTQLMETRKHVAPWIRSFPADHLHRVRAKECGDCWTLVIVLPKSRAWGFVQDGIWIPFKQYVFGGKARGDC